ncbi:hypothetical protein MJO28_000217 [Puccinia striiformis f. sp. tritici]|uniref:Uncharacterized protein n=1 Tax=Puccinia striiformis f. sp. tritici TaxID=168172 RepID=A0ACC0F0A2_9BASI|nr:hypothetical protein MJO28_000217 [Puccinia striiformis f. sp. tritici]
MGEDVTTQTGSKLSVREQLLLAQAVYQVQSSKQAKETIDWEQVNELLNGYQQARKDEDWLAGTSFNPTVCSIAYLDICKTYLEKNQDHQSHLIDTSQTLAVARQLYETHLKSIAAALLEEEKKSQNLQSEIEAIERGEWDDKLKAVTEPKDPTSRKSTPVQSPIKPLDSHPSPSHHEAVSNAEGSEVDKQSLVGDSLTAPVSGRHPHGKKSPISRSKRGAKKEKDAANSTETHSEDNDVSLGTVPEVTRGRKRKAAPVNLSQRKIEKTSHQEPEKPLATTPTDSPETPNTSESSASNDEETVMEQLTRTRKRGNASVPVTRRTRKGGLDSASERSEPLPPSSKAAQNKKIKAELHEDPPESKVSEKSLRSRTASGKVPSTIKEENATLDQEKHEQDLEANAKPSNNESPGANVSTRGADESHSALHSPNSNKRSLLENDHSVDGSHVGTPNSASFATGMTDGNSTANQTPNSAKVPLFPADASSAGPRAGSSSTTSDPTSFRRRMLKTHSSVQSNPISSIFRDPVKESEAPGYTSIIKRPMDLRTLAKKLRDGKVITTEEYRRDLMLMLANAVMFNHEESEVTKHAKELMVECDRLVSIFMRGSRY